MGRGRWCTYVSVVAFAFAEGLAPKASAQVVLDGTLGPAGPISGPDVTIPASVGQQVGSNLFHSFQTFSIYQNESATFTGPASLANVISRVTGGEASTIDGLLRSQVPNADFWFLNPAGVMFGPNARLDVPGSFHVSTADELRLADGTRFNATDPGNAVLSVAPPEAFGFLRANPAPIRIMGSNLAPAIASKEQTMSFIGGDIELQDAVLKPIEALVPTGDSFSFVGGNVRLISMASPGAVRVADGSSTGGALGRITVTGNYETSREPSINVSGGPNGAIQIRAGQFVLKDAAVVGFNFSDETTGGGISIDSQRVDLQPGSLLGSVFVTGRSPGPVAITAQHIGMQEAQITAPGGGEVRMQASQIYMKDSSVSAQSGNETSGIISITSDRSFIMNGGTVDTSTPFGTAGGGMIDLRADQIDLLNGASILSVTRGDGRGGNVQITANDLAVSGTGVFLEEPTRSTVSTTSIGELTEDGISGSGAAGDINIDVGSLRVAESGVIESATITSGNAGSITVSANDVRLSSGGSMNTDTDGTGTAGTVAITANYLSVAGDESRISSSTFAEGAGGNIEIDVARLELSGGGQIGAGTFGTAAAGTLAVRAHEAIVISGSNAEGFPSGLFTQSQSTAPDAGPAGPLFAEAERLVVTDGGAISSSTAGGSASAPASIHVGELELSGGGKIAAATTGAGSAGDLTIAARDKIIITGSSRTPTSTTQPFSGVFASSSAQEADAGQSGTIHLSAPQIVLSDRGRLSIRKEGGALGAAAASPQESEPLPSSILIEGTDTLRMSGGASITAQTARADAGDIIIEVDELIDLEDSAITTSVAGGQGAGGNISIDPRFLVIDNSRIVANAREGAGGNIDIIADFIFRSPDSVIDASSEFGISGTVAIAAAELDVTSGVVTLPAAFLDPAALRARCGGRRDGGTGSFTGIGRGGTGVAPDAPLPGLYSDLINSGAPTTAKAAPVDSPALPLARVDPSTLAVNAWLTMCDGK